MAKMQISGEFIFERMGNSAQKFDVEKETRNQNVDQFDLKAFRKEVEIFKEITFYYMLVKVSCCYYIYLSRMSQQFFMSHI